MAAISAKTTDHTDRRFLRAIDGAESDADADADAGAG
jgi:hypothetical protein